MMDESLRAAIVKGDLAATKQYTFPEGFFTGFDGGDPLRLACLNGHLDIVKYLVGVGSLNAPYNHLPLYYSITCGYIDIVMYLVSVGVSGSSQKNYAIRIAARHKRLEILRYLVEVGADVQADDNAALVEASASDNFEGVRYLVELGADRNKLDPESRSARYLRLLEKIRVRASKKIYYWWMPICHDPNRESGKRMMQQSFEKSMAGELC
jgi:hypothetical protein